MRVDVHVDVHVNVDMPACRLTYGCSVERRMPRRVLSRL